MEGDVLFFVGGGQLSPTHSGCVDDNRLSGVSSCGFHGKAPYGGSACCRPSVNIAISTAVLWIDDLVEGYVFRVKPPLPLTAPRAFHLVLGRISRAYYIGQLIKHDFGMPAAKGMTVPDR